MRWEWKPAFAGVVLFLFLAAQAAAFSHDLHRWLHGDPLAGTHECAAVVLQHGAIESTPTCTTLFRPHALVERAGSLPATRPIPSLPQDPPGRGPPAC